MGIHEVYAVLSSGRTARVRVEPGDLIGRLRSSAFRIDDPRISEAHAYVSLRDGSLMLLGLRGGLAVNGRLVREVSLSAGLTITLAKGDTAIELHVDEVRHPARLLSLEGPGLVEEVLSGRSLSLLFDPDPVLVGGLQPGAAAAFWTDGGGWVGRVGGAAPRALEAGQDWVIEGRTFRIGELAVREGQVPSTQLEGGLGEPVRIDGYFDSVHLYRRGRAPIVIAGAGGRLIYELGTIGQPVAWKDVAITLWPDHDDPAKLRKRWDVLMVRLRKRLADAAIRTSLVQADGGGKVCLLLEPADAFRDCG